MSMNLLLQRAQELPQPPEVMQELIASFSNPEVDINDVTRKIARDQVISAKVLRLANSARFGAPRNVSTINDAVIRLGFNAVRTLVLASGMVASLKPPTAFDIKHFWTESFTIASLSKWVAHYSKHDPETAFTCGMMHNIGQLLIHCFMPEDAQAIDRVVKSGADRLQMENNRLGFNHLEMGALLAERWQFPVAIRDSIALLQEGNTQNPYAGIVYIASYLNRQLELSSSDADIIKFFPASVAEATGIDQVGLFSDLELIREKETNIDEILH